MADINQENKFINNIKNFFKENFRIILLFFATLFIIFLIFQYYNYYKKNRILQLSLLYENAISNIDSKDYQESLNNLSNEKGAYGMLTSLELIKKNIENKNYEYAYEGYLKLLKNDSLKKIYISIIALQGSYNLINNISSDKIIDLMKFLDNSSPLILGYKYELEYLLSIKNKDDKKRKELIDIILNNINISENIKERVKKIEEFEKYK